MYSREEGPDPTHASRLVEIIVELRDLVENRK
jgi:hypothetical protein